MPAEPDFVPPYRLLLRGLGLGALDDAQARPALVNARFLSFLIEELTRRWAFDPAFYARQYPDVAAAMANGDLTDGWRHFVASGYREGRLPAPIAFEPDTYLAHNPDLAALFDAGGADALRHHYETAGRLEARVAHDATRAAAQRWQAALAGAADRFASRTIECALVQAFAEPMVAPEPLGFRGGVLLGDGPADALLRHRRSGRPVDSFPEPSQPARWLRGEYVYGGPCYHHFGHVMAEMIHRVLPARSQHLCRRLCCGPVRVGSACCRRRRSSAPWCWTGARARRRDRSASARWTRARWWTRCGRWAGAARRFRSCIVSASGEGGRAGLRHPPAVAACRS